MELSQADIVDATDREDVEALEQIMGECFNSLAILGKVLFPERFRLPYARHHHKMFELLDDQSLKKVVIAAPRGLGKTSIVALSMMARNILFRTCRFIPYVSKSETHAVMQTENLKRKLLTSKLVMGLFGSVKTRKYADMDEQFSKKAWTASLPGDDDFLTLILPRGAPPNPQQVRGLLFGDHRPDFFQVDDLEDDKNMKNPQIRKDVKEWFYGPLMGAVDQSDDEDINWRVIYTDTIKHHDALIEELLHDSHWEGLRLSICDDNYVSLAPGFKSTESIRMIVDEYRGKHQMDVFAREYMCQPISKESAIFKEEYFQDYSETSKEFADVRDTIRSMVIIDPARTSQTATGLVVWGIDVNSNNMYLRFASEEFLHPEQIYARTFELAKTFNCLIIGVENTGLNEFVEHPFRNAASAAGLHFEFMFLKARHGSGEEFEGKEGRKAEMCASLLPYYRNRCVYHNKPTAAFFEMKLLRFPVPDTWHVLDAASYVTEIMDEHTIYFLPTGAKHNDYEYEKEYDTMCDKEDLRPNDAIMA